MQKSLIFLGVINNVLFVAVQSNRAIGSGRVGGRQQHAPPTVGVASVLGNSAAVADAMPLLQPHPYYQKNNNVQLMMQQPYIQPTPAVFFDRPAGAAVPLLPLTAAAAAAAAAANVPPATRQFLESRPKLQDRLARHRQPGHNTAASQDAATAEH